MGKTTATASSKTANKPASTKHATAKKVKVGKTKIGTSTTKSKKVGVEKKKISHPPMPKGWPVSSKLVYAAPGILQAENNSHDDTNNMFESDDDGSHAPTSNNYSPSMPVNYLTPGNLLQQSCNGSDVFLRKRAVQSTTMTFPAGGDDDIGINKGGPSRFLIIFPGRMSLKAPPTAKNNGSGSVAINKDDINSDDEEEKNEEEGEEDDNNDTKSKKKKNPLFVSANPPQLLGKLVSLGGDERRVELHIPFPSSSSSPSTNETNDDKIQQNKQLVMSGRAIPLSGKYMALTFKRTGGSKQSGTGKSKKKGTGSIICKDVFRSAIVLGESKLVGSDGKNTVPSNSSQVTLKHYGGSERALDGGGKYCGGAIASRKDLNGGAAIKASKTNASSRKRMDSMSSEPDDDAQSSVDSVEDVIGSSDAESDGEFIPAAAKKRQSAEKRKANLVDEETTRKRTPRRSTTATIKYTENESSDDTDWDEGDSEKEDDEKPKANIQKKSVKRGSSKRKNNCVIKLDITDEGESVESSHESSDAEEYVEPTKGGPSLAINQGETAKKAGELDDELDSIASEAKKRLATLSSTPPDTPTKSPIVRGRRKKTSPKKKKRSTQDSLTLVDDDPFTFLSQEN